jgi:hypothetical protein
MVEPDYIRAHEHSSNHREELMRSDLCGCFYCLNVYSPSQITDWVDEDEDGIGQCALCAKCGIDSVIGSASGYPITEDSSEPCIFIGSKTNTLCTEGSPVAPPKDPKALRGSRSRRRDENNSSTIQVFLVAMAGG